MDRRSSIKTLLVISAGAALIPSCLQEDKKSVAGLKNIKIDGDDENLVAEISETIIPKTDSPGAKDVSAHLFALMMVDECYPPDSQEKFVNGLKEFKGFAKKKTGNSFEKATPAERVEILSSIESKKEVTDDLGFFYNSVKRLTVQAFTTSEYYLTKVHEYKLVPGEFHGCVPVKQAS